MSHPSPRTVAELLLRHAEKRSTGVLSLSRGQVRKQLFLRDGVLVSAESNVREEALGEVLITVGLLSRNRLTQLLAEMKRRGQKMGTVVIELGWVTPDDVMAALREQVRRRTVNALRLLETETGFEATAGFVGTLIEHRFDIPPLVFSGLRESSTLELLAPLLDEPEPQTVRLSSRFPRFQADVEAVFGAELTKLLAPGCDLGSLVMRPDAANLVYPLEALLIAGLARVSRGPSAAVERPLSGGESGRLPLREPRLGEADDSGFASFDRSHRSTGTGLASAPATDPTLPRDVMREFLEVHGRSPHDVLGVKPGASQGQLDRALAAKRARLMGLGEVGPHQELIDELLEAYVRAHAMLSNPTQPDIQRPPGLQIGEAPAGALAMDPLGAELAFGEGHALLSVGRPGTAVTHFRRAVDKRPDQAAYHAFLGWSLFQEHGPASLPESLDRLEHAVAVDPDSCDAHALLGAVLVSLGQPERARGHLERTLVLRPEQLDSIQLLARLYVEAGEAELTEKLYRRVLAALGERELPLRRTLWRELAELYEGPLVDANAAARAYAVAAKLDPADASLPRKAAEALTADLGSELGSELPGREET